MVEQRNFNPLVDGSNPSWLRRFSVPFPGNIEATPAAKVKTAVGNRRTVLVKEILVWTYGISFSGKSFGPIAPIG